MPHSLVDCSLASLNTLYSQLLAKTQESPHPTSRALFIAGWRCGWATPAACEAMVSLPYIRIAPKAVHIGEGWQPGVALDALLADVAIALHEADCLKSWRNELLAVFTGKREHRLGAIERAAVRSLGLLTKAVHLNAWTPGGEIWIARRSLTKSTDPGMWDTLVGGLISAEEDPERALMRESAEEAGLEPSQLAKRSPIRHVLRIHRRLPEGYQAEDVLASTCLLAAGTQPVNVDGEVMGIVSAPVNEVLGGIVCGQFTLEAALVLLDDIKRQQTAGELRT